MKRFFLLTIFVLCAVAIQAQAPQGINYQGVARDTEGNVLSRASLDIRIGLMIDNELVWQEDHSVQTNALGMFTLIIGDQAASRTGGSIASFSEIPWGTGFSELDVSVDPGSGFVHLGRSELMSVPFALYAQNGPQGPEGPQGEPGPEGPQGDPATDDQALGLNGTLLSITGGNSVDLSPLQDGVVDADADPENELQDLTFNGGVIRLSQDPGSTAVDLDSRISSVSGWELSENYDTVITRKPVSIGYKNPETQEPLFVVKNDLGNPVFAVYNDSVRVYVDENKKGAKGGFAVGGYNSAKGTITQKYAYITPESVQFWVPESANAKGVKGGFAVGGYNTASKGPGVNLLEVSSSHTRIQFDTASAKGAKGGFAVGGYNTGAKAAPVNLMSLTQKNYLIGENAGWLVDSLGGRRNLFIGYEAGYNTTTGSFNSFIGYRSGYANVLGNYNSFVGYRAGLNAVSFFNTFFGYEAGLNNTTGRNNIAIGYQAGYGGAEGITGLSNIFIGLNSGFRNTTGSSNIFMGTLSGTNNSTGQNNIFIGNGSGSRTENGNYNTYIGFRSGENAGNGITTDPSYNTFLGYQTGLNNVSGAYNTYIGYNAGYSGTNASGSNNVMIGDNSGAANITGDNNVFMGNNAGLSNTSGDDNVLIGKDAGLSNMQGMRNIFLGYQAGYNNIGTGGNWDGTYNVYIGYQAGYSNVDGGGSVAIGYQAGFANESANYLTALGWGAGKNSTGEDNTFIGGEVGYWNTTGSGNTYVGHVTGHDSNGSQNTYMGYGAGYASKGDNNVLIGYSAGYGTFSVVSDYTENTLIGHFSGASTSQGDYNVFLGSASGRNNTTGNNNTYIGRRAGYSNITGSGNVFLGYQAGYNESGSNKLYIDNSATSTPLVYGEFDTNKLEVYGNMSVNYALGAYAGYGLIVDLPEGQTEYYTLWVGGNAFAQGNWNTSDARYKKNIAAVNDPISKLKKINGVHFDWDESKGDVSDGSQGSYGVIAQEVEQVFPELVRENQDGMKAVNYSALIPVLIEAVKEQQVQIEALQLEVQALKNAGK